jgi:hypothetical protein
MEAEFRLNRNDYQHYEGERPGDFRPAGDTLSAAAVDGIHVPSLRADFRGCPSRPLHALNENRSLRTRRMNRAFCAPWMSKLIRSYKLF